MRFTYITRPIKARLEVGKSFLFLIGLGFVSGCASIGNYSQKTAGFYSDFQRGNFSQASSKLTRLATTKAKSPDALLWRIEHATVLRAEGKFEESNKFYSLAEEIIHEFDSRASISARNLGSDAAALVTSLNAIPYKGFAHDRIMINTFKALNYLALGQVAEARVEILRAYERQKEALARYQDELERAQQEARESRIDLENLRNDPHFKRQLERSYGGLSRYQAYADYVNPLTVFLDGLIFLATARSGADYERSRKDFERLEGMVGPISDIADDFTLIQTLSQGQVPTPVVYVIFESGLAPIREEIRIDIPLPFQEVSYVGAAFPRLRFQPNANLSLHISDDVQVLAETQLLSDMDAIFAQEFSNQLDLIVAKTLLSTVVKASAQYGLEKNFGHLGRFAGAVYSMISTQADVRSWRSLPKHFQFARFDRPKESFIFLADNQGKHQTRIELPNSDITLIYVKTLGGIEPYSIHTTILR